MGKNSGQLTKVNVYGDSLLQKLCPLLKTQLWIEVDHELTIPQGTTKKLYRKVSDVYKTKPKSDNTAVIMIGTYDIIKYNMRKSRTTVFVKGLKRRVKLLIDVLRRNHKKTILLTVVPILKLQDFHYHWRLLKKYNKILKNMASESVDVIDTVPMFLKSKRPPKCQPNLYEKTCCLGCPRKEIDVLWNENGILKVVLSIIQAVLDVRRLKPARASVEIDSGEKCMKEAVMAAKLEEICIADDSESSSALDYLARNGIDKGTCLPSDRGKAEAQSGSVDMDLDSSSEPEDNNTIAQLSDNVKMLLGTMRFREWSYYGKDLIKANKLESIKDELLTVVTYNVLSQTLLEKHRYLYRANDARSLKWSVRSQILLDEFSVYDADILCLQEVESSDLDPFYNQYLNKMGYEGIYKQRTNDKVDGCAIYFKSKKFKLVESKSVEFYKESVRLLDRDNIGIIIKLAMRDRPGVELVIGTTHLLYNPRRNDIKLAQTQLMLAEIERMAYKKFNELTQQPEYLPIIYTGDMNYTPETAVYELVTKGFFEYEGMSNKYLTPTNDGFILNKTLLPRSVGVTDFCQYATSLSNRENENEANFESGALGHFLNLASVYDHYKRRLPEATTNQGRWLTVDYIFYSQDVDPELNIRTDGNLKLVSRLSLPNSDEATDLHAIPNLACGSDHFPLLATFQLAGG